jgi:hypothetical protein
LILQNLKSTNNFLDQLSYDKSLAQMQISIQNVKDEIPKFIQNLKQRYGKDFDKNLENELIVPLKIKNINILLKITKEKELPVLIKCKFSINIDNLTSNSYIIFPLDKTTKAKEEFKIVNIFKK